MYTLYYSPGSANLVVHLALAELGVPYELRRVDLDAGEQRTSAYRALNPQGVVPTLIVDGQPHGEAAALTLLLTERHADAGLAPAPGSAARAEFLQWMFYFANTLQPAFRQWFYPGDHLPAAAEPIKESARIGIEKAWTFVDGELAKGGPFIAGGEFSAADLYALMLMRWSRHMPRPATDWPALAAFARELKARPAWKRVCAEEELVEWT